MNSRRNIIVFMNDGTKTTSSGSYTLQISNLKNPMSTEYQKYMVVSTAPQIKMYFFEDFALKAGAAVDYPNGVFPVKNIGFKFSPSASPLTISSIALVPGKLTDWIPTERFRIKISIDLSTLIAATDIVDQMEILELIFIQGLSDVLLENCHYLLTPGQPFGICSVTDNKVDNYESTSGNSAFTTITVGGLRSFSPLGNLDIYVWASLSLSGETVSYRHKIYDWRRNVVAIGGLSGQEVSKKVANRQAT